MLEAQGGRSAREAAPFFLYNGGSFSFNFGCWEDLPQEIRELAMGMLSGMGIVPTGEILFE
jgi:hypothetical protein